MLTTDIYGKTFSDAFNTAIDAYAQRVKPKVVITFLDSRHITNLTVTSNDSYGNTTRGTYAQQMSGTTLTPGYYFTGSQTMNGVARQTYPWAVVGDKDVNGQTIKANGNWYCMPSDLEDNYEFGWRSNTTSTANTYANGGYSFTTPITLEYNFDDRPVNKIKITTSEFSGKISYYKIDVWSNGSSFYNTYASMSASEYYKDHIIPNTTSYNVDKIIVTIYSTQNPTDNARIHEVSPLYEVDVTDYVINHSIDRQGEVWENSIPIAGTGSSSASITLDNTTKDFNPFNSSSLYGKYMKKDLKVNIYNGWRIVKTEDIFVNTKLSSSMTNSVTSMSVYDASGFLNGNSTNTFTLTIAPNTASQEIVLCSTRTDNSVTILQRGYAGTQAVAHSVDDVVTFDPYEYANGGEFYVDEWSGGTSMQVSIKCLDKSKFLTEKQLTKGFYIQNSTVGNAIKNILMQTNISQNELSQLVPYSQFISENAIASYSFATAVDRNESAATLNQGLRCRIWKINSGEENTVTEIVADAMDTQLTDYDKALGVKPYIPQSYTSYSNRVTNPMNSNTSLAVNMSNFTFVSDVVGTYKYDIKTTSTSGNPGNTYITYNNATQINATQLQISVIDKQNSNINAILNILKNGDSITIKDTSNSSNYQQWLVNGNITNNSNSWIASPVALVASGGTGTSNFSNNTETYLVISNKDSEYYNGVIDGFYIPNKSGQQSFELSVVNSGVRMYLDDTLIMDYWNRQRTDSTPFTVSSYTYMGSYLDLDAGIPYKIRIEFYHAEGDYNSNTGLSMSLYNKKSGGSAVLVPASDCTTVLADDSIGTRSSSWGTVTSTSPYTIDKNLKNRNHYRNNGIYVSNPTLDQPTGLISEPENKSVYLTGTSYIRIPYDQSLNMPYQSSTNFTDSWSIETYVKLPAVFSGDGEYISSWSNATSTSGFEFFNKSGSHGFKTVKSNGTVITVSSNTALSTTEYSHLVVTHTNGTLTYYVNGVQAGQTSGIGTQASWVNDITIGGRGASYVQYVNDATPYGETMTSTKRSFYIDEFAIYNITLDADTIKNRYITTKIKPLTYFPHLYGNDNSVKSIIDAITLADFGRLYVDEQDKFRYNHFYRFFESSIDQHANVQKTISSNSHIISGDYTVQLQTNKVTVSVTEQNPMITKRQGLWTATPDPSTLGVVRLTSNVSSSANTITVSTTNRPPFPTSGYLKIQDEIIKYSSIDSTHFLNLERAQFDTTAANHYANDLVREVRYYDIKYDNSPAFNIQSPLITGISETEPDTIELIKFSTSPYTAVLILAASSSVEEGDLAFIQGTNPLTGAVNYTAISGTPIVKQESSNLIKKQSATLADDIKKYGLKEVVIENEYIYSATKAQEIADFLIEKFKEPVPILNISSMAIPNLQIGDRIRISSLTSLEITNTDYWVVSHSMSLGDGVTHSIVLRKAG